MTPSQKTALEGVVGRALTENEVTAIEPHLPNRNDVAIANILSVNRKVLQSKTIGVGTILESMGGMGGQFLDALVNIGQTNREVYWAMVLINNSNLDIGKQATQDQMTTLAQALPAFAPGLAALKALGYVTNIINYNLISDALNIAEGRTTL